MEASAGPARPERALQGGARRALSRVEAEEAAYADGADRPLRSYTATMSAYGTAVLALSAAVRRHGGLPERIDPGDLALMSVATHKLSRLLSKGAVTSPLRAAFMTYEGTSGPSELAEGVRGTGWRHSVGELLSCPFCLAQWIATGFAFGFVLRPRATRLVASVLSTVAASDFLQFAYAAAEHQAEG